MKLRVSFIEYLNSVPLGWGFLHGPYRDTFEILFDVPSECARHLSTGEADVGLIPVIEYQRIAGLRILPDIAIASKREVKSVLFVSRVPLEEVTRVAIDSSSRTSAILLRILLHRFYAQPDVEYREELPDAQRMLGEYDAALVIGNPALRFPKETLQVYDLAGEWYRFTGLPFVFAFWGVRSGIDLQKDVEAFYESKEQGLREIAQIAEIYSEKLGIPAGEIQEYITKNLDYSLDDENLRGLETFFELAADLELIPSPRPLEFYERQLLAES